jgi:uncharacterized protein (DUF934 family)
MPTLIKWRDDVATQADDAFVDVADDQEVPSGDVIVSLARLNLDGDNLFSPDRRVGVRIEPDEAVEALAYDLPRLALVALVFPKFRDGRAYSAARILRERMGFAGELRAVGDVLLEQARFLVRCGFDSFAPADGATPAQWTAAAARFRHVYQRAADSRVPAFLLRAEA